jgi:hypothetical protein
MIVGMTNTFHINCEECGCEDFYILADDQIEDNQVHLECTECEEEYLITLKENQKC